MGEQILKVTLLNTFRMEYGGNEISFERNIMTKTNRLLQILFYVGENGIRKEQLLQKLFGADEVTNPSNSLRILVFRLRKLLAESLIPELDEYIQINGGVYRWTNKIPVEVDVHCFENLATKALGESDEKRQCELLNKACELYTGDFLPFLTEEEWVKNTAHTYQELYETCMGKLCELLMEREDYGKAYQMAGKAAAIYPLREWQVWQMNSLIAQNNIKDAMALYEETADDLFWRLGVAPSNRMRECLSKMKSEGLNQVPMIDDIQKELDEKEEKKGALYCSYPSFSQNYKFVKRAIERTGQSAYLLLCTITDGKGEALEAGERVEQLSDELMDAIYQALRRGDIYTKYSRNQCLILLLDLEREDCRHVIDRINKHFENPTRKNYVKYQIAPIHEKK